MEVQNMIKILKENNVRFFTGVPDSLLKSFCKYLLDNMDDSENIIAANEGNAVGIAAGYYLSTGEIPVCYMQNSGIGNAVNPMLSLCDPMVYGIPVLYIIGHRGKAGEKDEPQHKKQGLITTDLLDTMGIKHKILSKDVNEDGLNALLNRQIPHMKSTGESYALIVEKDFFEEYKGLDVSGSPYELSREKAIEISLDYLKNHLIVSTTGHISRELFELREKRNESHNNDFLTVGSMGHSSMIAYGIANIQRDKRVAVLDGDGAVIMHMGAITTIGASALKDFTHIVLNNGVHDSVGGQPTKGFEVSFTSIAKAAGYDLSVEVSNEEDLKKFFKENKDKKGKFFLEIRVKRGARKDLGRPSLTPEQTKDAFMDSIRGL